MGRKSKDAALEKIAKWTSILKRSESSKAIENEKRSSITSENENRTPFEAQSQSISNTVKIQSVCKDFFLNLLRM